MVRNLRIVRSALFLGVLLIGRESRAEPTITQSPDCGTNYYTIAPGSAANHWIIEVSEHPFPCPGEFTPCVGNNNACLFLAGTSYIIEPSFPGEVVIIESLTINRPLAENRAISVTLGTFSIQADKRLRKMQIVSADPWLADGPKGYVSVIANLDGVAGESALVTVTGPNLLTVNTDAGNVGGPITCATHPEVDPSQQTQDPYLSQISVTSASGNLTGDVTMQSSPGSETILGENVFLNFLGGAIGSTSNQVEIRADGKINQVQAKEVHALIAGTDTNPSDPDSDSYVGLLGYMLAAGPPIGTGLFTGEVRAEVLGNDVGRALGAQETIRIEGEMRGRIYLQRMETEVYGIAITRTVPALFGTISLRSRDQTAGTDVWASDVDIGPQSAPIELDIDDAEGYETQRTAASLGGGAAGLAPFHQHPDDCFPAFVDPQSIPTLFPTDAPNPALPMIARFYGPVKLPPAPEKAFTVEAMLIGGSVWSDITSCFTESINEPATAVLLTPTNLMPGGFEYRVLQNKDANDDNVLLCDLPDVGTSPVPVLDFSQEFRFEVCTEIPLGDASSDGAVNFADITSVLEHFNQTGCLLLGDASKDGSVNFADITSVLENFNAVWCVSASQSINGKGGGPANHMGFADEAPMSAADAAGLVSNALAQMGYASIEAFADAYAQLSEAEQTAEMHRLGQLLGGAE